jgi:hypothetical protein
VTAFVDFLCRSLDSTARRLAAAEEAGA